jgi:formylmethanofuran dehydrogenase subunit A
MSGIMKLIIKNGTVFNGERSLGKKDVEIQNGIITNIGEKLQGDTVIEAEGSFVSPGLTDAHIHMTGMSGGNLLMSTMTVPKQLLLLKSPSPLSPTQLWRCSFLLATSTCLPAAIPLFAGRHPSSGVNVSGRRFLREIPVQ